MLNDQGTADDKGIGFAHFERQQACSLPRFLNKRWLLCNALLRQLVITTSVLPNISWEIL
jgi:hypothetical protein